MKKITSFEHACEVLKRDPNALPEVSMLPEKHQKAIVSVYKLITVIEAQNTLDDFEANWNDHNQAKYYPWLDVINKNSVSGLGLSYYDYASTRSDSIVGSRLVVGSRTTAKYIFEQFTELYEDWFLI
jgi:hypothetical protein